MRKLRLRLSPRWPGAFAPLMLILSVTLNVVALCIPFMDVRRGLRTHPYSLWASIEILWESRLFVLAMVVVAFSVLFPFVKLCVMGLILLGGVPVDSERRLLAFVERYGKWSMLDVFLICIMLALANDQFWIDAKPRAGLLCFTLAIVASMLTSRQMLARLAPKTPPARMVLPHARWLALGQIALLGLLVAVLFVPFLEIDDWLLSDHPVSILSTITDLWSSGARELALIAALFLIVTPLLASLSVIVVQVLHSRKRDVGAGLRGFVELARHWGMLDVFALALGIFLIEGGGFVRTELSWGALLLALLLALYWPVASWILPRMTVH